MKDALATEGDEKKDKYYKLKSKQMMNRTSNFISYQRNHRDSNESNITGLQRGSVLNR